MDKHLDFTHYGHDLENVWLLMETANTIGISNAPLLDFYRTVFSYALQYGFDRKRGGFYHFGYQNAPAHLREKIWWVQAESLVSVLYMYHLTGEEIYRDCFCQILDWIVKYQIDWERGGWYKEVGGNGKPSGYKAESWKGPYHNGRAILECLELLSSLTSN